MTTYPVLDGRQMITLFGFSAVSRIALSASIDWLTDYARYVRLVRFSFLILIGRFVTLEP